MALDDRDFWGNFLARLEQDLAELESLLRPLQDGTMHTGEKSVATGGEWVDTTDRDVARLKNSITNVASVIADVRHRLGVD